MNSTYRYLALTILISLGLGALAMVPVISDENGYVAGFTYVGLLLLTGLVSFIFLVTGLITITKKAGPFLLISALLLPVGFLGTAFTAKYFEIGSYRDQPMVPLTPEVSSIVLFKKEQLRNKLIRFGTKRSRQDERITVATITCRESTELRGYQPTTVMKLSNFTSL